eukprot:scaffold334545_cov42-Prasinocladus_malaysianus.AAC.1
MPSTLLILHNTSTCSNYSTVLYLTSFRISFRFVAAAPPRRALSSQWSYEQRPGRGLRWQMRDVAGKQGASPTPVLDAQPI